MLLEEYAAWSKCEAYMYKVYHIKKCMSILRVNWQSCRVVGRCVTAAMSAGYADKISKYVLF